MIEMMTGKHPWPDVDNQWTAVRDALVISAVSNVTVAVAFLSWMPCMWRGSTFFHHCCYVAMFPWMVRLSHLHDVHQAAP